MGQKASKENYFLLENQENEDEGNEINTKESLGVNVIKKDSKMPIEMESFIIDTIVMEKLKNSGNPNLIDLAGAIRHKLTNQYGPTWCVLISKLPVTSAFSYVRVKGSAITLTRDGLCYVVFKSFLKKKW